MLQPLQLLIAAVLAAALGLGVHAPGHPAPRRTAPPLLVPSHAGDPDEAVAERVAERNQERAAEAAARAAAQPPDVPAIIDQAFAPLGPDALTWAHRVAFCESTDNPAAVNPESGSSGLFQFMPSTWAASPFASASPFDPVANADAAAWLYQTYGPDQWDCQ